jgi:hypothetical protein
VCEGRENRKKSTVSLPADERGTEGPFESVKIEPFFTYNVKNGGTARPPRSEKSAGEISTSPGLVPTNPGLVAPRRRRRFPVAVP